jgi:hypothetical protein
MASRVARTVSPKDRSQALALVGRQGHLLEPHLRLLRGLPAHGNRLLHVDQLFVGLLLSFFDPMIRSLRHLEDAGNFDGRLDLTRLARSTTADALAVFDPKLLQPIVDDLRQRVPDLAVNDTDLGSITRRIIAADGTYITTLANVAWALRHKQSNGKRQGQVRANVQMDVAGWTPQVLTVSGDDGESEPQAFAKSLLFGVLYVFDRNFLDFTFITQLIAKDNDFVLRVRANAPATRVVKQRTLNAQDATAGVIGDQIVELTGGNAPAGQFRLVTIQTTDRKGKPQIIRLLSNLCRDDIAAHVIGSIYRLRWQIELFFKWLKTWARMNHLLSTSRRGITFQLYVAVIGVLLMHIQSGRRVNTYTLAALSRVARGQCTLEQAMEVIAYRHHEADLNRARQARRRAQKKLV